MEVNADLLGAMLLAGAFIFLITVAEVWSKFSSVPAELTRKFVHFSGGFVCLLFPVFISSPWMVAALAFGMAAVFLIGERVGMLRSLHGVSRRTHGTAYYPFAILITFILCREAPWMFYSSVLVLAVADAGAALVGSRYGSIRYSVEDESKSVEGSLVFLILAFLALYVPMLLFSDISTSIAVLAALLVAVLITGLEAISLEGADNLFIPIGCAMILERITQKPLAEVLYQNISLAIFIGLMVYLISRARAFNAGGSITCMLFGFAAWSLGSEAWMVPLLAAFVVYLISWKYFDAHSSFSELIRVRTVARALIVPFLLVLLANVLNAYHFLYGPYLAASAAMLAQSLTGHLMKRPPRNPGLVIVFVGGFAALIVAATALPFLVASPGTAIWIYAGTVCGATLLNYLQRSRRNEEYAFAYGWDTDNIACTATAALVVVAFELCGVPLWHPPDIIGVTLFFQ